MMTTMTKKSTFYVVADNADTVFLILRADGKTRVFPFSVNELDSLMESYRLLSGGSVSVAEDGAPLVFDCVPVTTQLAKGV